MKQFPPGGSLAGRLQDDKVVIPSSPLRSVLSLVENGCSEQLPKAQRKLKKKKRKRKVCFNNKRGLSWTFFFFLPDLKEDNSGKPRHWGCLAGCPPKRKSMVLVSKKKNLHAPSLALSLSLSQIEVWEGLWLEKRPALFVSHAVVLYLLKLRQCKSRVSGPVCMKRKTRNVRVYCEEEVCVWIGNCWEARLVIAHTVSCVMGPPLTN